MSDLYIDGDMLQRVKASFANIVDLLDGPSRAMKELTGEEAGHGRLESRLDQFGSEWEHGIGELGEFSEGAVSALQAIQDAFDEADTNLADALNDAKEG